MENIPANLISLIAFAIVMLVAMLLLALKNRFAKQIDALQQQVNSQEIQLLEMQDLLTSSQSQ